MAVNFLRFIMNFVKLLWRCWIGEFQINIFESMMKTFDFILELDFILLFPSYFLVGLVFLTCSLDRKLQKPFLPSFIVIHNGSRRKAHRHVPWELDHKVERSEEGDCSNDSENWWENIFVYIYKFIVILNFTEYEHETINWPQFLDNYALISGHVSEVLLISKQES